MSQNTLVFVYEPEEACRSRLAAEGFTAGHALEVSSYLAQSTDLAPELAEIAEACTAQGVCFLPVELDDAPDVLAKADPAHTLVWTISDGIQYFRGGAAPAIARLHGLKRIGADDALYGLCQDKFRSGAVLQALGLPVPPSGLARNGVLIVPPPPSLSGYFVKPNRLGAKIGIYADSRCRTVEDALAISRRVHEAYGGDVVIQPYVPGRNVRASFLGVEPDAGIERLGVFFVDSGGDFQTMADSMALYGESGEAARAAGAYAEPELVAVADRQPGADATIREIAGRLVIGLGLRDVFSIDFRVEPDDTVHLIEFEICPGLPCFDFRAYCRSEWGMSLAEAIAASAAKRFG